MLQTTLTDNTITKMGEKSTIDYSQTFFHGTKANLETGNLIEVGYNSNYGKKKKAKYIYLTATLDASGGLNLPLGMGVKEFISLSQPVQLKMTQI